MKALILAGGYGSRLGSITESIPKPMVEVGGKPILWHIMKIYAGYGCKEFVILTGYKSSVIKHYFANYSIINNDFEVDLSSGEILLLSPDNEDWKVTVLDTGLENLKGSRIKQAEAHLEDGLHFLSGTPSREIHRFVEEWDADLIVLGTHGQKGAQLLLGSTANSMLHGASCDVLAVRVPERD